MSETSPTWRPLLDGTLADRALEAVLAIAEDIPSRAAWVHPRVTGTYATTWSAGLASGAAGQALFYGYLALHTEEERWADLALELLDRAGEAVAASPMTESLYSGFPGIAWVGDHLRGRLFEGDPDENRDVDEALLAAFARPDRPRRPAWSGSSPASPSAPSTSPRAPPGSALPKPCRSTSGSRIRRVSTTSAPPMEWLASSRCS